LQGENDFAYFESCKTEVLRSEHLCELTRTAQTLVGVLRIDNKSRCTDLAGEAESLLPWIARPDRDIGAAVGEEDKDGAGSEVTLCERECVGQRSSATGWKVFEYGEVFLGETGRLQHDLGRGPPEDDDGDLVAAPEAVREQAGGCAFDQTHAFLGGVGAAGIDEEEITGVGSGLADALVQVSSTRLELTRFQHGVVEGRADIQFNGRLRPTSADYRTGTAVER
jgi:hypothetical protein